MRWRRSRGGEGRGAGDEPLTASVKGEGRGADRIAIRPLAA